MSDEFEEIRPPTKKEMQEYTNSEIYKEIVEMKELTETVNRCPLSFPHPPHDYCDGTPASTRPLT